MKCRSLRVWRSAAIVTERGPREPSLHRSRRSVMMRRLAALAPTIAGCGFHTSGIPGEPGGVGDDGDGDGDPPPCATRFLDLCAQTEPSDAFEVTSSQALDTDADPRCRALAQPGGGEVCLIYATEVEIAGTATLTAIGGRPLAIASMSALRVEGAIDVSSQRDQRGAGADAEGCSFAGNPATDSGGGGGGAGGSFALAGGDGGTGDGNNNGPPGGPATAGKHGPVAAITGLRGGCRGQSGGDEGGPGDTGVGGAGGHAGGALYLFARDLVAISGSVRATGAGGVGGGGMAGGGGGGSGGLIVIESRSIMSSGLISANGGGGGQGGGAVAIPFGAERVPGNRGNDGALAATPAAGGSGAADGNPRFGPGGAGGAADGAVAGKTGDFGGGGGGGAAGAILIRGQAQLSGMISPSPTRQ
jgi:hypothetical protein